MKFAPVVLFAAALWPATAGRAEADDWPTFRGDAERSGSTAEDLPASLSLAWRYESGHPPEPAWSGRDTRMPFDRAYQPVVAGGRLFFGSSADCEVRALDAATGAEQWCFTTGAPVRFAPAVWKDRVLAAGDDGQLYCLGAQDGHLPWQLRGGPRESMVLGNGRMVSRWPARGGPVVDGDVVYFAAGIWPSEGIFLYAVDAATGKVIWCNDDSGAIYMGQPHGGANAQSGVSAQGHLVVAGDVLLAPTGRGVPAAFRRADGRLLYFHLQQNTKYGGSELMATQGVFFNRGVAFDLAGGARLASVAPQPSGAIAATADGVVSAAGGTARAFRWDEDEKTDRKGMAARVKVLRETWSAPVPYAGTSLAVAGRTIVCAGPGAGGHGVCLVAVGAKQASWSAAVDGAPWGLAVASGKLYVSTEKGTVFCFAPGPVAEPKVLRPAWLDAGPAETPALDAAAEEILRQSGVTEGYCVDLGCGDGSLALAIARGSKLRVYAIDADPANVAAARKTLSDAGLYGVRVTVHRGDPAATPYPDYFADLVVSGQSVTEGADGLPTSEMERLQRPCGGVACVGRSGAMRKTVRGPLDGAGAWTHQYCDPANTNCSTDTLVRGPLGVLWFDDLGFRMPSRHGRGPAPLLLDGRLFIEGLDGLLCVDAYNGRKLWHHPLPGILWALDGDHLMGISGTGSNICVTRDGLFVATGGKCLRIEPATGKLLGTFSAPAQDDGRPGTWGYLACAGDTLFGSVADTAHVVTYRYLPGGDMGRQFTESTELFAMNAVTGELRWRYRAEHSIRHNAIAVGDGRVYLIDRAVALGDRRKEQRRGATEPAAPPAPLHPGGMLVALDAGDGRVIWKNDNDIYGTLLALSTEHRTLLMCYQDWRFKLVSEVGGRMAAFDTQTGSRRWEVGSRYAGRPIINGRTIYLQPGAWDLLTGQPKEFRFARSYGCGILAGSRNLLVYRSATLGYTDLLGDLGTENYGGIRPGCWINAIPAGGLVLMPDATDGCTCSYLIKSSVVLGSYGQRPPAKRPPDGCAR